MVLIDAQSKGKMDVAKKEKQKLKTETKELGAENNVIRETIIIKTETCQNEDKIYKERRRKQAAHSNNFEKILCSEIKSQGESFILLCSYVFPVQ